MLHLTTPRLTLVLQSMEDVRAMIAGFPPEVRAQLSPVWLEQVAAATEATPWVHGFSLQHRVTGLPVGSASFKGPPSAMTACGPSAPIPCRNSTPTPKS
jgi:hypothetical protein